MAPRILICSASVGSGHGRAAQAIQSAITRLRPDVFVRHVDVLNFTNPLFRRVYGRGYFDAIAAAPHLVRYVYDLLDRPDGDRLLNTDALCAAVNRLNLRGFIELLTKEHWDVVVNTHFLPPEIISRLRKTSRVSFPQLTVTTDFDIHRLWVHSPCERYFTATEEGRANLAAWGIPMSQITASGIPIDPVFSESKSTVECRRIHGIFGDRPVVLQLSGGQGFGPAEKVHHGILAVPNPLDIVTISGRNEALRRRIEQIPCPARHRRTVLGYTDCIDEWMACADLIVSKPGGLTASEALASGAAMIVIEPIPGQEDRNCDFLLEQGAALKCNNLASLSHKITALISSPQRLAALRAASFKAGRPFAAFEIARQTLGLIEREIPTPRDIVKPAAPSRFSRLRLRRWRRTRRMQVS